MSDTGVRDWDPDRPVLAGLLARREELLASFVDLREGQAYFNAQVPEVESWVHAAQPGTAHGALAALASFPRQVVEAFDLGALLAEQLSDVEQVLGALRDEPVTFEVPVRTHTQPLVRIVMPAEGIDVRLLVQVQRRPLRAVMVMPMNVDDGCDGSGTRLGWTTGHIGSAR